MILAVGLLGCQQAPPPVETAPPKVTVQHPEERELIDYDRYNGWTQAPQTVEVRARVRGHIHKVNFEDGKFVKKGDLLFQLDPRPFEAEISRAKDQLAIDSANLEFAVAEEKRDKQLLEKKAVSPAEYERTVATLKTWEAKVEAAKHEIAIRELDLEYARIGAEISGRVGRAMLTEGNLVNAGGSDPLLTTIVAIDPIHVYFSVDERSLLKYRQARAAKTETQPNTEKANEGEGPDTTESPSTEQSGNTVKEAKIPMEFGLETDTGFPHKGLIDFANNRIDPETGTIEIRGAAPNHDSMFVPGSRVRVRIPVSEPYRAIVITDLAILSDQNQRYVLVVNDENVVVRRNVTLGKLLDDGMRVLLPSANKEEGITASDWVIVLGLQRARLNYPVEPVDANGKLVAKASKTPQPGPPPK